MARVVKEGEVPAAAPPRSGERLEGRRPDPPPTASTLLRLPPSCNFVYLTHPASWDVALVGEEEEPRVVPHLRRFHFEPGVSGVEQVRGASDGNPRAALSRLAELGWTRIDPDIEVTAWGRKVRGYAQRFDGWKGPVHLDVWTAPFQLGLTVQTDFDQAGWDAFRLSLIGSVVPKPDNVIMRALRRRLERSMLRRRSSETARGLAVGEVYEQKLAAFPSRRPDRVPE